MKRFICTICALLSLVLSASAADNVGILKAQYEKPGVAESFKVGSDWYPYPAYADRSGWDKLLTKEAKKTFIKKAEKYLGYKRANRRLRFAAPFLPSPHPRGV